MILVMLVAGFLVKMWMRNAHDLCDADTVVFLRNLAPRFAWMIRTDAFFCHAEQAPRVTAVGAFVSPSLPCALLRNGRY